MLAFGRAGREGGAPEGRGESDGKKRTRTVIYITSGK